MKLLRSLDASELREAGAIVLTIGTFDGVHLGHKLVVGQVVSEAKRLGYAATLITFDPHPRRLLVPEGAPPMLTSPRQKIRLLAELGLDICVVIPFTSRLARKGADDFMVRDLLAMMDLRVICVGPRFGFGRDRGGDTRRLEELGVEHGFAVRVVESLRVGGIHVSSTAIREMVERGDLRDASRLLGRPFSITGRVVKGKALGRELGIPTANLQVDGMAVPPPGVYAVRVIRAGRVHGGVLNIDWHCGVEVNIFGFRQNIYGEDVEVIFGDLVREERVFSNLAELAGQIRCDIEIAKQMLHNGKQTENFEVVN